ncbi:PAS domain-containing protein [Cellulomonas sp. ATA003]|uniref:PAS domain-containing protein n=1 Tax=Cellulomonas sp. ATA003 TaxID=3073064 RepID=UPI002873E248|nr:PAS domain-containing protein [Cellulomonas sp. ATA003]WNB87179.1 PAS domain-containing protein [Cellulomonas sp. ATA003]
MPHSPGRARPENRVVREHRPEVGGVLGELAIAAAGIGTFDWNLVTGRVVVDPALAELYGRDAGTPLEQSAEEFLAHVHPEDRPGVDRAVAQAVEAHDELEAEYRVLPAGAAPDTPPRWITARGRVLHDRDGTAVRLLGAALDVTGRQEGEEHLGRVLEAMPTAFFSLDHDWRFTYVNTEAERVLGADRQTLLGGVVWDLFPAAVASDFEVHYRHAMTAGEPVAFDAYYPPPLDAWYEVRAWPGPDGLSVYFLDITARRRAQEETQQAVRRAALIAQVTAALTETLDGELAVGRLAELVVPVLSDWCIVTLVDDGELAGARRGLRDIGWAHADAASRPVVRAYAENRLTALSDESFLVRALRTGEMVVTGHGATDAIDGMLSSDEARRLIHELAPETLVVLPLRGRAGTVGLISLFSGPTRAPCPPRSSPSRRRSRGTRASPWRTPGCCVSSVSSPKGCSVPCSPSRPAPTGWTSRSATSRRVRRRRSAGTGTTRSRSATGPRCWSSATSSGTTSWRPRRWDSCGPSCGASPSRPAPVRPGCSTRSTPRW